MKAARLVTLLLCPAAEPGYNDAVARIRAGDWEAGCQIAADLFRVQPRFYAPHNLLGLCAAHRGDRAAAERAFRQSIALHPKFADSRNNLGIELLRRGDRTAALAEFNAALTADSKNVTALYNLGRIELDTGDHQRALPRLETAAALAPEDVPVRNALAEGLALAGYADYKLGNSQRAEQRLRRSLELNPGVEEVWMNMAELLLYHQSFDASIAFLTLGLGKFPESARLHLGLGVSQLAAGGRDEEGLQHIETALQILPDFEPALAALCEAYHRNQQWKALERTAARWFRAHPQAYGALYYQALALQDNRVEAERLLAQSIAIQPRYAPSRLAMGKLQNELEKPAEALTHFQAAIVADPEDSAPHYQLVLTYRKLGQSEKSRQALAKFKNMKAKQQPWKAVFQLSKDTR